MGAKKKDAKRAAAKKALESLGVAVEPIKNETDADTTISSISSTLPDLDSSAAAPHGNVASKSFLYLKGMLLCCIYVAFIFPIPLKLKSLRKFDLLNFYSV